MTIYHAAFKVPFWVIVPNGNKSLIREFVENGAVLKTFPTNFKGCLESFKNRGYHGYLDQPVPFQIDSQLLLRAAIEHTTNFFDSRTIMNGTVRGQLGRLDLKIHSEEDYDRLYWDVVNAEPEDVLSRIFKIGDARMKQQGVFVSEAPTPRKILHRMADRVIEIGETEGEFYTKGSSNKTVFKEVSKSIQEDLKK